MNVLEFEKITFFDIVKEIDDLLNLYEQKAQKIIDISKSYSKLSFRKENKIISTFLFQEKGYRVEKEKKKISEEYKRQVYVLIKKLESIFLKTEYYFSNLSEERYSINKKSIKYRIETIREIFDLLLHELLILQNFTVYDFRASFKKIKQLTFQITSNIEIIENMYNLNTREVEKINYNKMKKLSPKNLKVGDIILFDKGEYNLNFFRKFLRTLLNSTVMHSSLIYKIRNNTIYVLEANSFNSRIVSIDELIYEKNFKYIVMRPKKKFTKKQQEQLIDMADEILGEKFNNFKLLGGSLERFREYIFHKLPLRRRSNPLKSIKGTFCSEIIVRIYQKLGIQLGISEDSSMASPIDILKSRSLDVIGILKK